MSGKNPKHKKKITEEDLRKHLEERNKNVVEKDNIPTFKPKKKVEDHVIKKDSYTNVHLNKKGEVVTKDEQGIYRPIVRKQTTLSQGKKKSPEEYNKEQKIIEEMQSNDLGLRAPLHYLANPDHMLGDLGNLTGFKPLQNFNNSDEDAKRYNYQSLDPSKSKNERFNNNLNEGLNLVPKASINLGLASLASKTLLGTLKEAYNPIAGTGDLVNNLGNKYLPNAYKLNPYAFKPNPEAYYRTLGKEGIDDAFNSGVIRPKQTSNIYSPELGKRVDVNVPEFPEGSYFNKSGLYSNKKMYNPDYIAEVVGKDNLFTYPERIVFNENIRVAPNNIPIEEANFYKKDWLKGYKPLNNNLSNPLIPLYRNVQRQEEPKNFAMGGNLKQQTNNNMLNEFNVGNSHENNPLGGIPQGMGNNGQMNTVEQGETKNDSFIYSNRITLTPQVIAQFNLPKSLSGKTAADATKLINNKFEGRNSKIDNNTKKAFLDRIAEAQETVKAEEQAKIAEAMQINSQEVPDMMEGQIPQGMEEYVQPQEQPRAYGGNLQNKMNNGGMMNMFGSMAGSMGNSMNTYGQQMNQSKLPEGYVDEKAMSDAQGNQMIDSTKDTIASATGPFGQLFRGIQKAGQGIGNSIGGEGGAAVSGIFSPEEGTMSVIPGLGTVIGAGVGAVVGGVAGFVGGSKAKKKAARINRNVDFYESNSKISNFALGGNMYGGGGDFDKSSASYDPTKISLGLPQQKQTIPLLDNLEYVKSLQKTKDWYDKNPPIVVPARTFGPQGGHSNYAMKQPNVIDPEKESFMSKASKYAKDNYGNALRYAPVAMNAYQLAKMGKPEVERLDRLGNRYNPQYMDERALTNQINAETNYTANALANASNGSLGSLSNNILGMQLNKTKALSDAYSKVADVNRNENKTGQQFNLGVDQFNVGQSNQEKDINARNRGAFKTERSKLLGQIGNDLGNIGKEQVYKKLAGKAFGYSYDGEYLLKPDGTKVSEEELNSTIKTNLSSIGATEKDGKYFDTTGKEISKEEVLKMIGTEKTFNKNYQGKFSSMNTNFGNISLTNNNKQ